MDKRVQCKCLTLQAQGSSVSHLTAANPKVSGRMPRSDIWTDCVNQVTADPQAVMVSEWCRNL